MAGLRRICKQFGGFIVIQEGKRTEFVWDYEKDEPVDVSTIDKVQRSELERKKWMMVKEVLDESKRTDSQTGS